MYLLADAGADMLALFPTQKLLALSMTVPFAGSTLSGLQRVDARSAVTPSQFSVKFDLYSPRQEYGYERQSIHATSKVIVESR